MKRLYLRVYLGFLTILFALGVLVGAAAWIGRAVFDVDLPDTASFRHGVGYLLTTALPAPGEGEAPARAGLATIAERFGVDLSLYDASRTLVAAVGPPIPPPRRWGRGGRHFGHRGRGPWVFGVPLEDGRWVLARWTGRASGDPWLPYWVPRWLAPLALLAIAIAVGAWPLSRWLSRRIERLQARVDELGEGSLSARVEVEGKDEVARLAESFNRAAERIESLVGAQRDMLAGASHELRTPLTRIRMAIELGNLDPGDRDAIERDIAELDELIDELLTAARLDAPDALGAAGPVDVLALLAEEGARVGAEVAGEPVTMRGSERLLRRLVRNLLENARRHGAGTPIAGEVRRRGGDAAIRVTNGGRPIPEHLKERIFEPFFRVAGGEEPAAGGHGDDRGVGLGLSLVRRIAERHGGRARLAGSSEEGTTFEVVLPAT